ncbi:hypothetical protein TNCV_2919471 [Trichonephila clavipes]|nr:hypothetical protein TNCV_2919471 [Trichonephila clavipes]
METYGDVIKIAVEKEDRARWVGMGKGDDSQKWNSCAALAMPVSFYVTSNRNHPVHGIDTIRVGKEKESAFAPLGI